MTLIELSIAIGFGLSFAGVSLALMQQQLTFLSIYRNQAFLAEEAPLISAHMSRLIGKAERFRLHASVTEALAGTNPRLNESPVLVLNFRQPDGSVAASMLSFENRGSGPALYLYNIPTAGALPPPAWYITKAPRNVSFSVVGGILRMTLTGPQGESVTYSGAMTL
jgi:hypothetical protein